MSPEAARQKAESDRAAAIEGKRKCEALLANADFQWFLARAVVRPHDEAQAVLRDLETARDEREIAAHVLDALRRVKEFLPEQVPIFERQIVRGV